MFKIAKQIANVMSFKRKNSILLFNFINVYIIYNKNPRFFQKKSREKFWGKGNVFAI